MTRRITITIAVTVLISVSLAGLGTLVLTRFEDRRATRSDLVSTTDALAVVFSEVPLSNRGEQDSVRARLREIQQELRLADAELLVLRNGEVLGQLPDGLGPGDLDVDALRAEGRTSGVADGKVYAASIAQRPALDYVIVATADANRITGRISRWIALSAVFALAAGSLLAWMLGRRLAAPINAAGDAAHRIAGGDLSTRVPVDSTRNDEITDLALAVNHMAASLDRARGLERQFLLSVSHDLRTPLTSIRGYAEAIADGTAPDNATAAGVIQGEARRLERLVTDLLDLAKLDARQFRLELQVVDLDEVVPDVCAGFEHQARELGVDIAVAEPAGADATVCADADRLAQIMANLLENALKFADGQVAVTYGVVGGRPQIIVADDGPGIASEDLPHVFERLYVANRQPRRRETGSGLGLAIVKELAEAMGGSVTAFPRPTGGTQFVVELRPATAGTSEARTAAPVAHSLLPTRETARSNV